MSLTRLTRREALQAATGGVRAPVKLPPCAELNNALEFDEQAKVVLPGNVYQTIAGGDHEPFDRITLRPRMNNPVLDMDLTVEVLGQALFTPIVVAPMSEQGRYNKEAEMATLRGAEAAHALVVVSSRSTVPIEQIAARATAPFWYSVYLEPDGRQQAHAAVAAGAKAVFVTVGATPQSSNGNRLRPDSALQASSRSGRSAAREGGQGYSESSGKIDWAMVDLIRKGLTVPLVIKGIMTPDEAKAALQHDVQGIVVSNFGGLLGPTKIAPMDALTSIVDAVAGKVPVLIDGSFRRGTCVLKALALGAQAVLIGRPVAWGLATYGSEGVQTVLELIQNELARSIGMVGVSKPQQLTRAYVRLHKRATT